VTSDLLDAREVAAPHAFEYRLRWQREGVRPQSKLFQTFRAAMRRLQLLGPRPWEAYGRNPEERDCCFGSDGCGCGGVSVRRASDLRRAQMPKLLWARVESRACSQWRTTREVEQ